MKIFNILVLFFLALSLSSSLVSCKAELKDSSLRFEGNCATDSITEFNKIKSKMLANSYVVSTSARSYSRGPLKDLLVWHGLRRDDETKTDVVQFANCESLALNVFYMPSKITKETISQLSIQFYLLTFCFEGDETLLQNVEDKINALISGNDYLKNAAQDKLIRSGNRFYYLRALSDNKDQEHYQKIINVLKTL